MTMPHDHTPTLPGLDQFSDVLVSVEVRIGNRRMTVEEILRLEIDSTIRLDKPAGETLDLLVGNMRLASAEVVVIEDRLAVRITELDSLRQHAPSGHGSHS